MPVRATGERPIVVWDEGGSDEKAKEEGGADLFKIFLYVKIILTISFLVSIKCRGHKERTKDDDRGRGAAGGVGLTTSTRRESMPGEFFTFLFSKK